MSLVWPILAHLSAEPLVGLKLAVRVGHAVRSGLSAEPLVGLKPAVETVVGFDDVAFSRTPRGFEAQTNSTPS